MKLPIFRLILFFFVLPLGLTSCDKDDPEPTKTDLLVAQEWQGKAVFVRGIDVSNVQQVKDMLLDIKNTNLKLERDGKYVTMYTQAGTTQSTEGTWALKENDTVIFFDVLGDLSIKELTATTMTLTQEIEFQGMKETGEVVFERRN